CEFFWGRPQERRSWWAEGVAIPLAIPRERSWAAMAAAALLTAGLLGLAWCLPAPANDLFFWLTPAVLLYFLEEREYHAAFRHAGEPGGGPELALYPAAVPVGTALLWWASRSYPVWGGALALAALGVYSLGEPWLR